MHTHTHTHHYVAYFLSGSYLLDRPPTPERPQPGQSKAHVPMGEFTNSIKYIEYAGAHEEHYDAWLYMLLSMATS